MRLERKHTKSLEQLTLLYTKQEKQSRNKRKNVENNNYNIYCFRLSFSRTLALYVSTQTVNRGVRK